MERRVAKPIHNRIVRLVAVNVMTQNIGDFGEPVMLAGFFVQFPPSSR